MNDEHLIPFMFSHHCGYQGKFTIRVQAAHIDGQGKTLLTVAALVHFDHLWLLG
jgi:hypothetical protein